MDATARFARRPWLWLGLVGLLAIGAHDASRAPERQWGAAIALAGIDAYQGWLSPLLARSGLRCRFTPTCSHYAEASIRRFGLIEGAWRSLGRVLRCGPWTPLGTVDLPDA